MKIGVLKEDKPNEKRVALTPATVSKIRKLGYDISIESNAGLLSNFFNNAYNRLAEYGVKEDDIYKLEKELKKITSNSLTRLEKDIASIQKLIDRRSHIISSDISNIDKFQKYFKWQPKFNDIKKILSSAVDWEKKLKN